MVVTPPSHADMPAMPMPQRETPAIHGMFMFGSDTVFLSGLARNFGDVFAVGLGRKGVVGVIVGGDALE
jgi:hypothetical protein